MSIERNVVDLSSLYDDPIGEIPQIPIGVFGHTDGNSNKKPDGEVAEMKEIASQVGAEITDRPNGEHNTIVIKHRAWIWVGGALATAMGLTAAGLGTAFAIEHHRRKTRKK